MSFIRALLAIFYQSSFFTSFLAAVLCIMQTWWPLKGLSWQPFKVHKVLKVLLETQSAFLICF